MLPFFRCIRRQLARDNKFFQYSRYAIGEIVLVVIGILIALQINNWNEQQKENQILDNYLLNLQSDLSRDRAELKRMEDFNLFKFYSGQLLLTWAGLPSLKLAEGEQIPDRPRILPIWDKPYPAAHDTAFTKLVSLWSIRPVVPRLNSNSWDELKSTGYFSKIKNQKLKDAINNYYNESNIRFALLGELEDNWKEALFMHGILAQDITNVEILIPLLSKNSELAARFKGVIRASWYRWTSSKNISGRAQQVLELIEEELHRQTH